MENKERDTRFEKFGTVSFAKISKVNDFIDYLEQGKIMGTRCKDCGRKFFPPRADCYASLTSNMEWFEVAGTGKLLTFSTLRYAPAGFTDEVPYTIALADFGECKMFGRMDQSLPEKEYSVGMAVRAVAGKTPNGKLTYYFTRA